MGDRPAAVGLQLEMQKQRQYPNLVADLLLTMLSLALVLTLAVACAIAWVSHRFAEPPFLRPKEG